MSDYEQMVERLLKLRPDPAHCGLSGFKPIRFSAGLLAVRERLEAEFPDLVRALEDLSPKLAVHFGKHEGLFARLCLLWHCIEAQGSHPAPEISAETTERVAGSWRNSPGPAQ